jgi:hypothetical protein
MGNEMTAPEKIYIEWPLPGDGEVTWNTAQIESGDTTYIRADLHNKYVASAERNNSDLLDRLQTLREERDALRNAMSKFTMDTLGEMVKFSPPPPIHLTVTQEQADKIIEELK